MELIGILGGSFNPVHIGHLMLANYITEFSEIDCVWLTLSPQNPFKLSDNLLSDNERLKMLEMAVKDAENIHVCDIELTMPRPSFTIDTLNRLSLLYPDKRFKLIIGSDNWAVFDRWKDYEQIIEKYGIIVYPRPGYPIQPTDVGNVEIVNAPLLEISSSFIREGISQNKNMNYFLPQGVYKYITDNNLY